MYRNAQTVVVSNVVYTLRANAARYLHPISIILGNWQNTYCFHNASLNETDPVIVLHCVEVVTGDECLPFSRKTTLTTQSVL